MGQTADQIKQEIETQRDQLGENLQQLETKVKETVDWRTQFSQRPMAGVGLAFGAGFLLSVLMPSGGKSSSGSSYGSSSGYNQNTGYNSSSYYQPQQFSGSSSGSSYGSSSDYSSSSSQSKPKSPEMNEINETIENIRGAVMGLAATRLRSFLAEAVPGFQDEYEQARTKRGASDMSKIDTQVGSGSSTGSGSSLSSSGSSSSGSSGSSFGSSSATGTSMTGTSTGTGTGSGTGGTSTFSPAGSGNTETRDTTPSFEATSPTQATYRP